MLINYLIVVKVIKVDGQYEIREVKSNELMENAGIPIGSRCYAHNHNLFLGKVFTGSGNIQWKRLKEIPSEYVGPDEKDSKFQKVDPNVPFEYKKYNDAEIRVRIADSYSNRPDEIVISELSWKLGTRAVLRGENILLTGPSGFGKTLVAKALSTIENRPFERFNMGSMQDARASLIGNTHYDPQRGTFFAGSLFITAIQTKGIVILLDEYTRISPDAENIMLSVLDKDQRYVRIDEDPETPTIKVAEGVCFIATANVGAEYTATRIIDRATRDRFSTIIDMPVLTKEQEINLLRKKFPELNRNYIDGIAQIAAMTRDNVKSENPTLDTVISTRSTVEQSALALDGFRFTEIMEALVFTLYSSEGGTDSNRSELQQNVQALTNLDNQSPLISENKVTAKDKKPKKKDNIMDDLFNPTDDAF